MELEARYEHEANVVDVYYVPDYCARFNRKTFPVAGFYYVEVNDGKTVKWSGRFNDAKSCCKAATIKVKEASNAA